MFINWIKALSELHASNEHRAQGNDQEKWRRVLDWHSISNLRSGLLFSLLLSLHSMFVSPRPRPLKKRSTKHDLILFSQSQTTCHSRSQISDNLLMPLSSSALIGFLWHLEMLSIGPMKLGSLPLFVDQLVFQGHIKQIQGIAQTRASNLLFTFTDAFLDIRSHLIALTLHLSHPMINL